MTEACGSNARESADRVLDKLVEVYAQGPNFETARADGLEYFQSKLAYARTLGADDADFAKAEIMAALFVIHEAENNNWVPMHEELLDISEELVVDADFAQEAKALVNLAESIVGK